MSGKELDTLPHEKTQEQDAFLNTPVYLHSGTHARENGELDVLYASDDANMACVEMIEKSIADNYADNRLNSAVVYDAVVDKFGAERVKFILANSLRHRNCMDDHFRENHEWAQTVPMLDCFGSRVYDRSLGLAAIMVDFCLVHTFISYFRKVQANERSQTDKESILAKIQKPLPARSARDRKDKRHER